MAKIDKDMIIQDLIAIDPDIITILLEAGMHCIGCPASQGESLEEAAEVHAIDADELVDYINKFLAAKEKMLEES